MHNGATWGIKFLRLALVRKANLLWLLQTILCRHFRMTALLPSFLRSRRSMGGSASPIPNDFSQCTSNSHLATFTLPPLSFSLMAQSNDFVFLDCRATMSMQQGQPFGPFDLCKYGNQVHGLFSCMTHMCRASRLSNSKVVGM